MRMMLLALALLVAGSALVAAPAGAVGVSCTGAVGVSLATDPLSVGVTTPECTVDTGLPLPPLPP